MISKNNSVCPICEKHEFNGSDITNNACPVCGWKHDQYSEDNPSETNGTNDLSLFNYKYRYMHYIAEDPDYTFKDKGYPEIPQVESMDCPVCKKTRFAPLTWDDIYCGMKPSDSNCMACGWHYDPAQHNDPTLKNGANVLSLNEYIQWYHDKLKENPDYDYFEEMTESHEPIPHKCPVCGKYEFADECCFDVCPYCGWEDDGTDDDTPNIGANNLRFSEFKKRYEQYVQEDPSYRWDRSNNS